MKLRLTALAIAATASHRSRDRLGGNPRGHAADCPATAQARASTCSARASRPNLTSGVTITRDGEGIGSLTTDATGAFNGSLRLGQRNGRRTQHLHRHRHEQPDAHGVRPRSPSARRTWDCARRAARRAAGCASRRWASRQRRQAALGPRDAQQQDAPPGHREAEGRCKSLTKKRRLLPRGAPVGVYTVQFDAFRKYQERRAQSVGFTITVRRVVRPAAAASAAGWSRLW